jgi:hypothetical protein
VCVHPLVPPSHIWYIYDDVDMETQIMMPAPTAAYDRDPIESFEVAADEVLTPKAVPRKGTINKERYSEGDEVGDNGTGMECECHVSVRFSRSFSFTHDTDHLGTRLKMKRSSVKGDAKSGIMSGQSSLTLAHISLLNNPIGVLGMYFAR